MAGIKHVLGIWVQQNEGASFWASVCADLANRGIRDVLVVCCDGLTGFPRAIAATWSHAAVQTCVVHLIRNAMRFVSPRGAQGRGRGDQTGLHRRQRRGRRAELDAFAASGWEEEPLRDQGFRPVLGTVHPVLAFPPRAAASDLRPTPSSR